MHIASDLLPLPSSDWLQLDFAVVQYQVLVSETLIIDGQTTSL